MSNSEYLETGKPGNEILFTAIGGLGRIGMNVYLYGYKGKWLVVDFGIGFTGDDIIGSDIYMPDISFLKDKLDDVVGIVCTHAHEDHVGAIGYLWKKLKCPIYSTAFTSEVILKKLQDNKINPDGVVNVVETGSRFNIENFDIELVDLNHSTLESQGLMIRTEQGNIFHTGDWKFDENPVICKNYDEAKLKAFGEEGVLLMVGDSTNVFDNNKSLSESDVEAGLAKTISECEGRVVVTCFASNIERMISIKKAADIAGRKVALVGRSLWRMDECARNAGYLSEFDEFLEAKDIADLEDNKVLYICTGSQGERNAALARIAENSHRELSLDFGDTVIFSSRVIPGNEKSVSKVHNSLVREGIEVITSEGCEHTIHVSGHATRKDVEKMYGLIKPKYAIPMHGEEVQLHEHALIAEAFGSESTILDNGVIAKVSEDGVEIIDEFKVDELVLDGGRIVSINSAEIKSRMKMANQGLLFVTLVMDENSNLLTKPQINAEGFYMTPQDIVKLVKETQVNFDNFEDGKGLIKSLKNNLSKRVLKMSGKKCQIKINIVKI